MSSVKVYSLASSSSSLSKHLKDAHDIAESGESDNKQSLMTSFATGVSCLRPAATPFELNRDFAIWAALDLQPFDFVSNDGMQYIFAKNFPSVTLPSRITLSDQAIDDVYDVLTKEVARELRSVRVICVMFDGWTDNQGKPFVGLRAGYITKQWEYKVVTISCKLLNGHTAKALSNHVHTELERFMADYQGNMKDIRLFTTHDGAANMVKSSQLLKSDQFIHCVSHSLHLLMVTDGLNRVCELKELLEKCSSIVTKLHFKGCDLQEEEKKKDSLALSKIMEKIEEVTAAVANDTDDPVLDSTDSDDATMEESDHDEQEQATRTHKHTTLKKPVVTRWNSALYMVASKLDNIDAVDQVLLRSGLGDLRLQKDEKELLAELRDFLKPFEENTQLVSSSAAFLSLIVLVRQDIKKRTAPNNDKTVKSHPAMIQLKQLIANNVDRRLRINKTVILATLMDPSTKLHAASMVTEDQLKAYYDCIAANSGLTDPRDLVIDDNTRKTAIRHFFVHLLSSEYGTASSLFTAEMLATSSTQVRQSQIDGTSGAPRNKKLKLLDDMEPLVTASSSSGTDSNATHGDGADGGHTLLLEITAYLGPVVVTEEEKLSPLMFWKRNEKVYPHLSLLARVFLTPSASSVPVESLFSITGLIKNTRRSSLAPFRLNKLTFVHDNYSKFFPIGK